MWLAAVVLAVGALGITAFTARHRRTGAQPDPGWMSEQWLAEQRAGIR